MAVSASRTGRWLPFYSIIFDKVIKARMTTSNGDNFSTFEDEPVCQCSSYTRGGAKTLFATIWKDRLASLKCTEDDPNRIEPQDHVQIMVHYAKKNHPEEFNDPDSMTWRLIAANFGSMHQTSIQVTKMLLNIIGSDTECNTIAALRDETRRVLENGGDSQWTKAKVAQMVKPDSVARETIRLHSFGGHTVLRKVKVQGYRTT